MGEMARVDTEVCTIYKQAWRQWVERNNNPEAGIQPCPKSRVHGAAPWVFGEGHRIKRVQDLGTHTLLGQNVGEVDLI